jgi:hypothetical protein
VGRSGCIPGYAVAAARCHPGDARGLVRHAAPLSATVLRSGAFPRSFGTYEASTGTKRGVTQSSQPADVSPHFRSSRRLQSHPWHARRSAPVLTRIPPPHCRGLQYSQISSPRIPGSGATVGAHGCTDKGGANESDHVVRNPIIFAAHLGASDICSRNRN